VLLTLQLLLLILLGLGFIFEKSIIRKRKRMDTPESVAPKPIRMPPQVWGPIFWATLHIASLAYSDTPTDRQKTNIKNFYESMVDVLPCPICRHHYEENLKTIPLDEALKSRMGLVKWVWQMHNKVNIQLGKREITFEEFIESMQNLENTKKSLILPYNESNKVKKSIFDISNFTPMEGIILGTGVTLISGISIYYLYQESIRRSLK